MTKPKLLAILCHCDDEVLAAFPVMQSEVFEKHLIITCSDYQRKGERRREALQEVCRQENINLYACLDIDNNFYQLPTRRASYILTDAVKEIEDTISKAISDIQPDYLFTHNPMGSYGHGSHRLLWEIVSQHPQSRNVLFTDICQTSNHRSHDEIPHSVRDAYYRKKTYVAEIQKPFDIHKSCKLDSDFYARTKAVYDKTNSWTWDFDPIETCNLFIINED